jgi:hypothetical protein
LGIGAQGFARAAAFLDVLPGLGAHAIARAPHIGQAAQIGRRRGQRRLYVVDHCRSRL